jgi:hypothetical protein
MGSELGLSWEEIARVKRLDEDGWLKEEKGKGKPPEAPFLRVFGVSEFQLFFFPPLVGTR